MIREATRADEAHVIEILRGFPSAGPSLEVRWRLLGINPSVPFRFYLVGEKAVLEFASGTACLVGVPEDGEELVCFLASQRAAGFTGSTWVPPAWRADTYCVMEWKGHKAEQALPEGFTDAPLAYDVIDVLETDLGPLARAAREAFYFNLCLRRNHGFADVVGICAGEGLASTAGVYALTEKDADIQCVATRPNHKKCGYATALVRELCSRYSDRRVTLACRESLAGYYSRLGFQPAGLRLYEAKRPVGL